MVLVIVVVVVGIVIVRKVMTSRDEVNDYDKRNNKGNDLG